MPLTVPEKEVPPAAAEVFFAVGGPFLDRLDEFFDDLKNEFEPELRELVDYALSHSGKRLRPLALFLTGARADGSFDESLVRAAAVVELVHLATLVHDDILDEADLRHDQPTVSRRFGVAPAVLLGDALFAQSLQLASRFPTTEICRLVSEATRKICAGEIEQSLDPRGTHNDLERYFRIIERKTAVLFDASCRLGALLGEPGPKLAEAAGEFGRHLGLAYQIYDDLVDVIGREEAIGKTLGTDFASGKGTLPFLLLKEELQGNERAVLQKRLEGDGDHGWAEIQRLIIEKKVVSRVAEAFANEMDQAKRAASFFKPEAGGARMRDLVGFVEDRFEKLLSESGS